MGVGLTGGRGSGLLFGGKRLLLEAISDSKIVANSHPSEEVILVNVLI